MRPPAWRVQRPTASCFCVGKPATQMLPPTRVHQQCSSSKLEAPGPSNKASAQRLQCSAVGGVLPQDVKVKELAKPPTPELRIPRSLAEVDKGQIMGFGADLAEDHPGYGDEAYKRRRSGIAQLAERHREEDPIPRLHYLPEETKCWATVLRELRQLYPTHACHEFLRNFPVFNFREDEIPQLEDISQLLRRSTGWRIQPVAGLLHPRHFLNGLAFKNFHSTQYVRHHSRPMYTPEPDICHELLGHTVMLADPFYADLVHTIGVASLAADEKQIWHLTKVYWFTVEFGVVREGDGIKAFGAGLLSSYGELQHMRNGNPGLVPFDPFSKQPKMSYKDGFQKQYFVLDSCERGAEQLHEYCRAITPPEILERFQMSDAAEGPSQSNIVPHKF